MTGAAGIALIAMAAAGCSHQKQETAIEYMPDMAYQRRVGAQHEDPLRPGMSVMRNAVEGTVPRGYRARRYTPAYSPVAQRGRQDPLARTGELRERGQRRYLPASRGRDPAG